jgi:hypothetical protein
MSSCQTLTAKEIIWGPRVEVSGGGGKAGAHSAADFRQFGPTSTSHFRFELPPVYFHPAGALGKTATKRWREWGRGS